MTALVTDGLEWWATATPDQPALIFDGGDIVDYATLARWSDGAARMLADSGLRPGDRIGLLGANSLEWCVAALGAVKLGAVAVPFNNRFTSPELEHLVNDAEPTLVASDAEHRDRLAPAAGSVPLLNLGDFTALRHMSIDPLPRPRADADDLAVLVYTSGTTAKPKGVEFTHRTTHAFIHEWGLMEPALRQGSGLVFVLSMSGAPGILWQVLLHPLTRGMTVHYERGFEPATTLSRLASGQVQVILGVPVVFERMAELAEFAQADLSGLELATVAGARVSTPTLRRWLDRGVTLRQSYGMTELGGLSTMNPVSQAFRRPESVGRDGIFTRHRVVRSDGSECDPEEAGEIVVRGPAVTPRYWRNPAATAEALRDGWFHTGDVGVRDRDGYLRIVDRLKDMIISGGFNIAPSEIEAVIAELPGVEEVCVVSIEDPKFGEASAAVVSGTAPPSEQRIREACQASLASFKQPRLVVFTTEPLPRMASGKIARRDVRSLLDSLES